MSRSVLQVVIQGNAQGLTAAARTGQQSLSALGHQAQVVQHEFSGVVGSADMATAAIAIMGHAAHNAASIGINHMNRLSRVIHAVGATSRIAAQAVVNKWAALGAGVSVGFAATRGADLDRTITRIKRTAGASRQQADQLREDLHKMAIETGSSMEDLVGSFSSMIQSGQSWDSAKGAVGAISKAVALTGANADDLAKSLAVAGETFNFDLTKPRLAQDILDKMLVAGDLGSAEMEDLSGIFAKVGANAKAANFTMEQTLGLVEVLSKVEKDKDRLGTMADSTLRMFTNYKYMLAAAKATGVKFYDANGGRRDPAKVLVDMAAAYKRLNTQKQRDRFIAKAWGEADQDTQKGIRILLDEGSLSNLQQYVEKIQKAPGEITNKTSEGMANAASQTERLRESLKKIGDDVARPINDLITKYGKIVADHQDVLKNVAIGAGALVAVAVAITAAAKAVEVWRTIRSVFGGGGATGSSGGLPGGLGGLSGLGSSPTNPMYVVVVGGGANPGGLLGGGASGVGGLWGRLAEWGKSAWKYATSPLGAGILGGAYAIWDEGGLNSYSATRIGAQQLGAALGSRWGTPGRLIMQAGFDQLGVLVNKGRRMDASHPGISDSAIEESVSRQELWAREHEKNRGTAFGRIGAEIPPINFRLYNVIDRHGNVEARMEGDGPNSIAQKYESLGPSWAVR